MKKLVLAILVLGILASGASAVSMTGKIGLGLGWTSGYGFDNSDGSYDYHNCLCPHFGITRIGLLPSIVLSPIVEARIVRTANLTSETTYDIVFSPTLDFAVLTHTKTNVYAKAGVSLDINKVSDAVTMSYYKMRVGLGLEHFVSKYFAVLLSTMFGISYESHADYSEMIFSISNRDVNLALVWYY